MLNLSEFPTSHSVLSGCSEFPNYHIFVKFFSMFPLFGLSLFILSISCVSLLFFHPISSDQVAKNCVVVWLPRAREGIVECCL